MFNDMPHLGIASGSDHDRAEKIASASKIELAAQSGRIGEALAAMALQDEVYAPSLQRPKPYSAGIPGAAQLQPRKGNR